MRISDWSSDVCSSDLLAPPPATAGGGWEGVPTVRVDPKDTPPQPSPAFAGEGAEARGFRGSYRCCHPRAILRARALVDVMRPQVRINADSYHGATRRDNQCSKIGRAHV